MKFKILLSFISILDVRWEFKQQWSDLKEFFCSIPDTLRKVLST